MRKVIVLVILVAIMCTLCACSAHSSNNDKEICKLALEDLSYNSDYKTSLELVHKEFVSWLDCDVYTYIMKVVKNDDTTEFYIVDVQRNENEIHFVDVISKI